MRACVLKEYISCFLTEVIYKSYNLGEGEKVEIRRRELGEKHESFIRKVVELCDSAKLETQSVLMKSFYWDIVKFTKF